MNITWKAIVGYEGLYLISQLGQIKNARTDKILGGTINSSGYPCISLWKDKKSRQFLIHRLILETFVRPPALGEECRHLDGNRMNFSLENLIWGTRSDNMQDRNKHGWKVSRTSKNRGSSNSHAQLTDDKVIDILGLIKQGQSNQEIAKIFNVKWHTIRFIRKNISWKHIPR